MATDRYVLVFCRPCANSRSLADVRHSSRVRTVHREPGARSCELVFNPRPVIQRFHLLFQRRSWNISSWHLVIGSTRALDLGSRILASALLAHPHPHRSDSDSGYAKPHLHHRCSIFKFELAQVRSSDVPYIGHGLTVL